MVRVTLHLADALWRSFRAACITRKLTASREIARLIREQLAAWGETVPDNDETASDDLSCSEDGPHGEASAALIATSPVEA